MRLLREMHEMAARCRCLIATLSRGPARKSDSVCNSIWFQLSFIRKMSSVHVHWIPTRACLATHCQRGADIHQSSVRLDLAAVKALIRRTGQEEFHARDIRDAHSATHGNLAGKTNPQCRRPSAQNGPQPAFGQLTPPYRTTVYGVFSLRK